MSISSNLTKLTTDITNAYTSIENKGGTIPANKNTDNLHTAIDSIEVIEQATAEGESLSLTNTKAMPYKDYVVKGKSEQSGEPSPSNPSEIHSVADDVNLWSLNSSYATATGSEYVLRDTSINKIPAGTYTLSLSKSINSKVMFAFKNASNQEFDVILDGIEQETITFTDDKFKTAIYIYGNQACTISNIKLQKGTTSTPYSPYNQGTVTIKQRGTTKSNDYTIQTEPLRSLPNGVKDTIEEDGIHRRVGKIVLNGTETWEEAGTQYTGLYSVFIYIDDMKKQEGYNGDLLSNYFKENDFSTQEEGITKSSNPTSFALILIRLSNDNATNMTTFKNWLSNNPTELLYELATEVIEPLTQNQATTMLDIIKTGSYEGTTNIYTDEDVKPTIGVEYYKKG